MRVVIILAILASTAFASPISVTKNEIKISKQIYFSVAKPTIVSSSYPILDAIAVAMTKDRTLGLVEIGVHTDARGSDQWNLELSQKRADAIRDYLIAKGVASDRLRAKGYGETKPIDKGTSAEAMARNRRTQFVILQRITT